MKALVADDDRVLADLVSFTLRRAGFQVILAYDGEAALRRWVDDEPDIIVLDVNMPRLDGFAVCRRVREKADTPIILLTVRGEEDDIVRGLQLGADDYIPKPFSPRELVARVRAVLRRVDKIPGPAVRKVGELTLNTSRREMWIGEGEAVSLTPLENRLLDYLMLNAGSVVTTDAIIDHVWGPEGGDRDMLRQLVRRLRKKMSLAYDTETGVPEPENRIRIDTVPGLGYGLSGRPSSD